MNIKMKKEGQATPAVNGRFGEIAALAPQKRQCELGSYYPARTFVKPLPRQAAGTLGVSRQIRSGQRHKKLEN